MVFGFRKFDLNHSELYEIVEEKSRDILEESGDLTWNIHGNVGNETFKRFISNNTTICNIILQVIQQDLTWNIHGNVGNFGILLAIPDLQTFLHSELYEIVEEKSRDILKESPIVSCTKLN